MTPTLVRASSRLLLALFAAALAGPAFAISVSLTAPANNAVFPAPAASITLSATATPTNKNRPITKVEFFRGGTTLIGTDTSSPYSFNWTNVPAGTYSITAKATDSSGATATSAARSIKLDAPPAVTLTAPANNAVFPAPAASITLTASASDSDGTVAKVDFFQGATLLGTDTTSPYSFTWTNVASGSYTLTARATDNNGVATTSAAVSIKVDTVPSVSISSPANNAVFTAGTSVSLTANAADADGTVAKVEFFDGATLVGTSTAAPFGATLANLAAGTHTLTARATDNLGLATTSAAVTILGNVAPTVAIGSPASGAVFAAPASITISATAADADGTVAKVDFLDGGTLVGTATAAPYGVALANVAAGTHSYTARATDNQGAVTTSAAVNVTVDAAPAVSLNAPAANAVFTAPASVGLSATATDTVGVITKVDFYQGTTLIGTATAAPYNFTWTNVAAGAYSLTAVATNDAGQTATSAAVPITVNPGVAQIYYIEPDHLNTPRMIANGTGTTVWRWDQAEPFGNDVPNTDPDGDGIAFDFPLRFPGQYFDRETNVVYNHFRDYDPTVGRYVESDPLGLVASLNTYAYVRNMPLRLIDPLGLLVPEVPKTPQDAAKRLGDPIDADSNFGKAKGMECAQKCDRIKNRPPYMTDGLVIIDICNELMPWLQGHLRGATILDACVDTCMGQYPKICDPKKKACVPDTSSQV